MIRLTRSQPVALLGEAPPRVLVAPARARANSWEDVADLSARAGVVLDGWQEIILEASLGERGDGLWAAKRVGVSVPRQNGKSQLMVARILAGVLLFEERKIVVSAHQADTARESFNKLIEILEADGNGWLMDRVRPNGIMNAINREAVKFRNGATVQFKARTGAGGRGFSSDCLMLDEAQRLKRSAWVSINSTMSAMPNPQVWLLGTPPTPEDEGEVFGSVRDAASTGKSDGAAWAEWGADPGSPEYAEAYSDLRDRRWSPAVQYVCWSANPAWNQRINHEVVQGELETYSPDEFGLDRLGIWASDNGARRDISPKAYADAEVAAKPEGGSPGYAVAFSANGMRMALAGGVPVGDGAHVELIDRTDDGERGLGPLADWFVEKDSTGRPRWRKASQIVLSGQSGALTLKQLLLDRKVSERRITVVNTAQYLQACGMLDDAFKAGTVTHLAAGQDALDESVGVAVKDKRGGWASSTADGDEVPVEAVSLAYWVARTAKAPRVPGEIGVIL